VSKSRSFLAKSEGIEPFNLVNSPPGSSRKMCLRTRSTLHRSSRRCVFAHSQLSAVSSRGHSCKSEGIEPFNLVNSSARSSRRCVFTPDQTLVGSSRRCISHTVNFLPCHSRVYPRKSEGIEPFNLVNSLPGQVDRCECVCRTRSTLCRVKSGPCPRTRSTSPSGSLGVSSPVSCTVPASVSNRGNSFVPSLSPLVPVPNPITPQPSSVTSPSCFTSSGTASVHLNTTQATSHKQPMALTVGSDRPRSAFIEEVDDEDLYVPHRGPPTDRSYHSPNTSTTQMSSTVLDIPNLRSPCY